MKLRFMLVVLLALVAAPLHPADTPAPTDAGPPSDGGVAEPGRTREELEEELDEFVPSEDLPADSAISFPVDI